MNFFNKKNRTSEILCLHLYIFIKYIYFTLDYSAASYWILLAYFV